MVQDAVSWIGGGSYIEGLGKLLGDLIDSKDDGGLVSCSKHTDDQEAVGRNVVNEH